MEVTKRRCVVFAKHPQSVRKASAKRSQSVRKASAKRPQSVRKRPQASASVREASASGVTRAAKAELHRMRVAGGVPGRSETVNKLRGSSTGRAWPGRSGVFRNRQAKGKLHRTRVTAAYHVAFRGVSKPSS